MALLNVISESVHWIFAVEYFSIVENFQLIIMAANPYGDLHDLDAKTNRLSRAIKVLNVVFSILVTVSLILTYLLYSI